MAECECIQVELVEETINAILTEEVIDVTLAEETIEVALVEEIIEAAIVEEIINVEIVEEIIQANVVTCSSLNSESQLGQIFVTDVVSNTGIVGNKIYEPNTVPVNAVIKEATTDDDTVTINFMVEGGLNYSPIITVDGIVCTNLQQYVNDRRLFYGSVDIVVSTTRTILVESSTGSTTSVIINRAVAGPEVLSCLIGEYPGSQTAVKFNDIVHITGTVEAGATHVRVVGNSAFQAYTWIAISGGIFDIAAYVGGGQGSGYYAVVEAKNSLGTIGNEFQSSNTIILDQLTPQFVDNGATYPSGQAAFKNNEIGYQDTEVSDFTSLVYSSPNDDFSFVDTTTYTQNKEITCTHPGSYNDSTINFRIIAYKQSNDTQATFSKVIEVADIAPIVSVSQSSTRLVSSPSGVTHTITATSNQKLADVPDLDIPVSGTWLGSGFTGGLKIFTRQISIIDSDAKGSAAWGFVGVAPKNNAGLSATITGNEVVGGFTSRTLTIAAWPNREVDLGTNVADVNKLTCENLSKGGSAPNGGTIYTYDSTITNEENEFTITSPSGIVNINGNLWYNKDQANAVSNTSGTAQIIIEEIA